MGNVRFGRPGEYLITRGQARDMEGRLLPGDILLGRKNWPVEYRATGFLAARDAVHR